MRPLSVLPLRAASVLFAAFVLAACPGGDTSNPDGTGTSGTRPTSTATVTLVSPRQGDTVDGPDVIVETRLTGGRILKRASTNLQPDTGHIHVFLDGKVVELLAGARYRLADVPPGQHTIKVEFVAADHGSFDPPVFQVARITVR